MMAEGLQAGSGMRIRYERHPDHLRVYLEEFIREDFIRRALVLHVNEDFFINEIFFNSSKLGTVHWNPDKGYYDCHSWETEDQAMDGSYLQRMYPTILHNGEESIFFAQLIVDDILSGIEDPLLLALLQEMRQGSLELPLPGHLANV